LLLIERYWLAVEDTILASSPESFVVDQDWIKHMFRYTVSICVMCGCSVFQKIHNRNILFIQYKGLEMMSFRSDPKDPVSWPGWNPEQRKFVRGPNWLLKLFENGIQFKGEVTRIAHLTSKQGFPAPRKDVQAAAVIEHHKVLCETPERPLTANRLEVIEFLAFRIGVKVLKRYKGNVKRVLDHAEHISLTNRSSYASSREDGGRAKEVSDLFQDWATKVVDDTSSPWKIHEEVGGHSTLSPWGMMVEETHGLPRWKSFIHYSLREDEQNLDYLAFFDSAFIGTNRAGLNQNCGIQILQMAFESLVTKGVFRIDFSPYTRSYGQSAPDVSVIRENDEYGQPIWHSSLRTSVKPETGGKSRIFTIQEWDRTIYLQPLGHFFTETLKVLEDCKPGFTSSNAGWDWAQHMGTVRHRNRSSVPLDLFKIFHLSANDLVTATDYGDWRVGRAISKGYFAGLEVSDNLYLKSASDLLNSGINLESAKP